MAKVLAAVATGLLVLGGFCLGLVALAGTLCVLYGMVYVIWVIFKAAVLLMTGQLL